MDKEEIIQTAQESILESENVGNMMSDQDCLFDPRGVGSEKNWNQTLEGPFMAALQAVLRLKGYFAALLEMHKTFFFHRSKLKRLQFLFHHFATIKWQCLLLQNVDQASLTSEIIRRNFRGNLPDVQ